MYLSLSSLSLRWNLALSELGSISQNLGASVADNLVSLTKESTNNSYAFLQKK